MVMDSATTDTRERVALAKGAEPAPAREDPPAPLTLKQRLAAIRDECAGITKDDIKMGNFTIKGHTFEAVLSEVRPMLHKHGVDIEPNLFERSYNGNRCDVLVDFTFLRTDESDESRTIRWGGAGTDNGDKAFAKAGTNCVKEMLKKRFLISDREDAKEAEEAIEHQTAEQTNRAELERSRERERANLGQWAKTFKAALETAPTVADVDRLKRENRDQLDSPELPEVTRSFFNDLIADRKAELADGFPGDK
jgi:hypothetical protein